MSGRFALAAALAVVALTLTASSVAGTKPAVAAPYPVTVTVDNGTVTIRKRPSRIVSLSPTATETLFAIGAGRQVVAVDDQSDYPKQAPHTSLSGFTPNVEAIAALKPDLVVIAFDPKGLSGALNRLGIPVVFQNAAPTLPAAYTQIRQLGKVTGHAKEANALAARMGRQIRSIVQRVRAKAIKASVYHELDDTYYSATSETFIGRVYRAFGLKNIADQAKGGAGDYPQLSSEFIVSDDRDQARGAFTKAVEIYSALGAVTDVARLQTIFRAHGIRRGPHSKHRSARSGWDSLTPTEVKVAALVGEDEARDGTVTLKDLRNRTQVTVARAEAAGEIRRLLAAGAGH